MTKKNRKKHGLSLDNFTIFGAVPTCHRRIDMNSMAINGSSCALCQRCRGRGSVIECSQCLVTKTTGQPCDAGDDSPWDSWALHDDPKPMIKVLKKCLRAARKENSNS